MLSKIKTANNDGAILLSILDNTEKMTELDPENMYNRIFDLPEQMSEALKIASAWKVEKDLFSEIKNIVVIGMGGSAIGGDLVRTLLGGTLLVPFQVCRHYVLPEYVDDESLVIVSSYSGNTEETLAAFEDALERKAMIVGITTGGFLEESAQLHEVPILKIPEGLQPRAAIGFSFVPLLIFLEKIGLVKKMTDAIKKTSALLTSQRDRYIESEPTASNPAKKLAEQIKGKIPIVYGGPTLTDVVSVRWKGQICENAKNMAFANNYAEFNHNELVAWCDNIKPHAEHFIVIQLRDADDHPKIRRRMDIVHRIIAGNGITVLEVESFGDSALTRMFSLIQLADFVSYYLALLNEVDPTPVEAIETLKKELAG